MIRAVGLSILRRSGTHDVFGRGAIADHTANEVEIRASGFAWTTIRAPKLTTGPSCKDEVETEPIHSLYAGHPRTRNDQEATTIVQQNKGPYFAVNVRTADLAGLRITQAVYPPRTRLPRHGHAQPYLCLVAAGGFEERLRRRSATCSAGTVIWNPSSEEHDDIFGESGGRCWNVEFTHAWGERLAQAANAWTPAQSGEPAWLAIRIMRELSAPDTASSLTLEGLVCALIGEISRSMASERRRPSWLSRARERLHAEYREPPTVAELARDAGVHRSHFARAFRRYTGCTVADFVRHRRVEWAAEQLRVRGYGLAELSLSAGFGDQAHFTRTFKRVTGVTPGAYRATMR